MILQKGYTMMHEHITIDLSAVKGDLDCRLDCMEETICELRALKKLGVGNLLDVTNRGMGRNPEYVREVEQQTGIRVIQSTGYYKEPFLPEEVCRESESVLAQFMVDEIENGIMGQKGSSRYYAGMIGEIGTSKGMMEPMEKKVFDAAITAAKKTGKPIYTHTTLGTYGVEQAEYMIKQGVDPLQIIIGHMDLSGDLSYVLQVLDTGVYVGFDTIGKENYFPDADRVRFLMELERRNVLSQVVLSMDITRKSQLSHLGGIGYTYLFTDFLPMLRRAGMKESSIDQMLIRNPEMIFH